MAPALLLLALAAPFAAQTPAPPDALTARLDLLAGQCRSYDQGVVTGLDRAIRPLDLTGDGEGWVLDTAGLSCSSAASLYCGGTGGCEVTFAVGAHVADRLTKGWTLVRLGRLPVILMQVHGTRCGGTNLTPCAEALIWDAGAQDFASIAPPPPEARGER